MKPIDLMYQTMLAELGQRSLDAAWTADFLRKVGSPRRTSKGASTGTSTSQMDMVARNVVTSVLLMIRISRSA